jgi:hypothetical protein
MIRNGRNTKDFNKRLRIVFQPFEALATRLAVFDQVLIIGFAL